MIHLSDALDEYLDTQYIEVTRVMIRKSFELIQGFGYSFFEDKYMDLITREDTITRDDKRDGLVQMVRDDLLAIIEGHYIELNKAQEPTLDELYEIANFLYAIQQLENFTYVQYRLHSQDTPKNVLISLITRFSLLDEPRVRELITDVSEELIAGFKAYVRDRDMNNQPDVVDAKRLAQMAAFFKYTENTPSMGLALYDDGYLNVTIDELFSMHSSDLTGVLHEQYLRSPAQAALDILGILLLCVDSYELPMLFYKTHIGRFLPDLQASTRVEAILLKMLADFHIHREQLNKELADAHHQA